MPVLGAAASITVVFIVALTIPLRAATTLELSPGETTTWILAIYGIAGALSLFLAFRYKQPLLLTGNIFILILIERLGTEFVWGELIGAAMAAGAFVLVLGPFGLTGWLTDWLPAPVVFGLLAGAVVPFLVDMFGALEDAPVLVGGTLVVYLAARRYLEPRVPAILPALAAALVLTAATGGFNDLGLEMTLPAPVITAPIFSPRALLSIAPVFVVLITVQANVPSLVFLREQDYDPPELNVNTISGTGTVIGSILGPIGVSLSLPATALVAGRDAGEWSSRHLAVYIAAGASLLIGVLAGFAVEIAQAVPMALLLTGVGLAVLGILSTALQRVTEGPLIWGPLFAFLIALSDFTLLGLQEFFWALAGGVAVSAVLEWEEWKTLRQQAPD